MPAPQKIIQFTMKMGENDSNSFLNLKVNINNEFFHTTVNVRIKKRLNILK